MPNPTEPHLAEAVPVTLMRIEGMIGGVAKDITNLTEKARDDRAELVVHRGQISEIQSNVQQLQSDQRAAEQNLAAADKAREDTAAALEKQNALALAKAKDAVDSEARQTAALGVKTATVYAPRNFGIALVTLIVAAVAAYAAFKFGAAIPATVK